MSEELDKVVAASLRVLNKFPYYNTAINAIRFHEDASVGTMGVTAVWSLHINPAFVKKLTKEQLDGVYMHELLHLLRNHHLRGQNLAGDSKDFCFKSWNAACDLEDNQEVIRYKFALPVDALLPQRFNLPVNLVAEEYYPLVKKLGLASRLTMPDLDMSVDAAGSIVKDAHDAVLQRVNRDLEDFCRNNGLDTNNLRKQVEIVEVKVPWQRLVRRKLTWIRDRCFGFRDVSYRHLSRKSASNLGIIFPKFHSYKPGQCIVIVDVSCSMMDDMVWAFSQVKKILADLPEFNVTVIECDTKVKKVHNDLKRIPEFVEAFGGTNLKAAFEYIKTHKMEPNAIVVLTDGYTPWPADVCYKNITVVAIVNKPGVQPPEPPYFNVRV